MYIELLGADFVKKKDIANPAWCVQEKIEYIALFLCKVLFFSLFEYNVISSMYNVEFIFSTGKFDTSTSMRCETKT